MKIAQKNQLKIIIFTAMKNGCMLHGHVFVMTGLKTKYMYVGPDKTHCILGNFACLIFFKINFLKKFFLEYHRNVKQFRP